MKNKYLKIALLLFIGFFYITSNSLLTHILYPYGNKGIFGTDFYLKFNGHLIDIIDLNIPHFIVFVVLGIFFKGWAIVLAILSEPLQVIIRHNQFSFIDVLLNLSGAITGILITKLYAKKSKAIR